ncbi:MAG: hypothetical protein CFH38_00739 [Alphaproteobacteria bacterium MarineAlpha10_Bin1]|nr:MAG: hypothetical protein CFH38_00739 [Alphaproteobacteria bacterium MarineAlpha10_Bin1]
MSHPPSASRVFADVRLWLLADSFPKGELCLLCPNADITKKVRILFETQSQFAQIMAT